MNILRQAALHELDDCAACIDVSDALSFEVKKLLRAVPPKKAHVSI
jgi:hypothetical protein